MNPPGAEAAAKLQPLRQLLARLPDLSGDAVESVEYLQAQVNDAQKWVVSVRWSGSGRHTLIDAETGAVIRDR